MAGGEVRYCGRVSREGRAARHERQIAVRTRRLGWLDMTHRTSEQPNIHVVSGWRCVEGGVRWSPGPINPFLIFLWAEMPMPMSMPPLLAWCCSTSRVEPDRVESSRTIRSVEYNVVVGSSDRNSRCEGGRWYERGERVGKTTKKSGGPKSSKWGKEEEKTQAVGLVLG